MDVNTILLNKQKEKENVPKFTLSHTTSRDGTKKLTLSFSFSPIHLFHDFYVVKIHMVFFQVKIMLSFSFSPIHLSDDCYAVKNSYDV